MKFVDKITEALGLYDEEEILEEEYEKEVKADSAKKKSSLFAKKNVAAADKRVENEPDEPAAKSALFRRKNALAEPKKDLESGSRTIALPLADKQVKVVVLEPSGFDDSQKIADYLRNKQPVVVNFDNTDSIVTKRMTDFISGTIYALGGSMKKIGKSILVCAPKNVDIDAGVSVYDDRGRQPWEEK